MKSFFSTEKQASFFLRIFYFKNELVKSPTFIKNTSGHEEIIYQCHIKKLDGVRIREQNPQSSFYVKDAFWSPAEANLRNQETELPQSSEYLHSPLLYFWQQSTSLQ